MSTGTRAQSALRLASLLLLVSARPALAQWGSNGNPISVAAGEQSGPAMVPDGVGGALIVWQDTRSGSADLYIHRVTGTGAIAAGWPANGLGVCTGAGDQKLPAIAADGAGGVYVAWEDYRAGGANADIYLQRITAAGAVATGWPANGLAICTESGSQGYPAIAADAGGAIVAWQDDRGAAGTDIYVQRATASGTVSWTAGGVPLCSAAQNQLFPSLVSDGAGGAIVIWQDARSGSPDVYAQRVSSAGSVSWTADGVAVSSEPHEQLAPRAVPDGAGGAVVTWDDYRDFNADIYAQRVSGAGALLWAAGGVALCVDPAEQYGTPPVPDGAGGAIVVWTDFRGGSGDLYAQRVTGAGAISSGWPASGTPVSTAPGDQFDAAAVSDGFGGVIVAWADARPATNAVDLYAQRLTSAGSVAPGWVGNGTLVCNAANNQLRPAIVSDGAGGAILAWSDERSGPADLYAKRMPGSGSGTVDVAAPGLQSFALLPPAPNPMRGATTLHLRLERSERVTLEVLDLAGRRLRVLADGLSLGPGAHSLRWDARDQAGAEADPGLYFAVLRTASGAIESRRLTVLR